MKVTALIKLNLITGRAMSHIEEWDTSLCDANAATFLNFTRVASAAPKVRSVMCCIIAPTPQRRHLSQPYPSRLRRAEGAYTKQITNRKVTN